MFLRKQAFFINFRSGKLKKRWQNRQNNVSGFKYSSTSVFVSETGIILTLNKELDSGYYNVVLRVGDNQGLEQESTVKAEVCDCTGEEPQCHRAIAGGTNLPVIMGILGGVLLLLSESIWFWLCLEEDCYNV